MKILLVIKIYLLVGVIFKSILFWYIANNNNYSISGGGGVPPQTFWFYKKPVSADFEKLKRICNFIQWHNILILLILLIICGIKNLLT